MAYTPTAWVNDGVPDLDATHLNHIETGIADAHGLIAQMHQAGDLKAVAYPVTVGVDEPSGWLLCDGRSVLRATYVDLFAKIGTVYGSADGTHFNLPDPRGRSLVGAGSGAGLTARALGAAFGEENHVLTVGEMPSHNHGGATGTGTSGSTAPGGSTFAAGSHSHSFILGYNQAFDNTHSGSGAVVTGIPGNTGSANSNPVGTTADGSHAHSIAVDAHAHSVPALAISSQGGGGGHNVVQPSLALNILIKT